MVYCTGQCAKGPEQGQPRGGLCGPLLPSIHLCPNRGSFCSLQPRARFIWSWIAFGKYILAAVSLGYMRHMLPVSSHITCPLERERFLLVIAVKHSGFLHFHFLWNSGHTLDKHQKPNCTIYRLCQWRQKAALKFHKGVVYVFWGGSRDHQCSVLPPAAVL